MKNGIIIPGVLFILAFASVVQAESKIWLIGDSTVASYSQKRYPQAGWGQALQEYCKPGVKVVNRAIPGFSTKSYYDNSPWSRIMQGIGKGDYLFIQFGHNDQKIRNPKKYTNPDSTYRDYLKKFISESRSKGAIPILVTPICRRKFTKAGKLRKTLGKYPDAVRIVAKEEKVPLVDLNAISFKKFQEIGPEKTKEIFNYLPKGKYKAWPDGRVDDTHFKLPGAKIIAGWVVENSEKQKLPVAELFKK